MARAAFFALLLALHMTEVTAAPKPAATSLSGLFSVLQKSCTETKIEGVPEDFGYIGGKSRTSRSDKRTPGTS
eukprot:3414355-Amphidinium_carterae.1